MVLLSISMDPELLKMARAEMARQGGLARSKALSKKQIKAIATKASKAAAIARTQKAKARKRVRESEE
jgi:hypothetical protein